MTAAARVLEAIARTLPAPISGRYREEWHADLRDAAEAGVTPASVVWGAAATALSIDRSDPALSGFTRRALAGRRARWGLALLGVGALLAVALFITLGWGGLSAGSPAAVARSLVAAIMLGLAVAGLGLLVRALALVLPMGREWSAVVAVLAAPLALVLSGALLLTGGVMLALFIGGAGLFAVILLASVVPAPSRPDRRGAAGTGVVLSLALLGVAVAGVLHVTVWNPLAKLPGMSLDEIYAGLAAAAETPSPVVLVLWATLVVASAIALLLAGVLPTRRLRTRLSTRRILVAGLVGITGAAFSVWVAGFSHGMSIADAFMTSGGDAAISGKLLVGLGIVTGIPAILLAFVPGPIARDRATP